MRVPVTVSMTLRQRSRRSTFVTESFLKCWQFLQMTMGITIDADGRAVSESRGERGSIDKDGKEDSVAEASEGGHHDFDCK